MSPWLWILAPFIGLLLGLFGAGGGMLTVPLLVYAAGLPLKQAIAMSLWVVAGVSLVTAVQQRVWRVLRVRMLTYFGVGGIAGGVVGAWLGTWIAPQIQQLLFGLLLLGVAAWTARAKLENIHAPAQPCRCVIALLSGAGLGVLTGLLGVGGGFLMVPTLIALGISHLPTAVAHSLVLITVNAVAAGVTYSGQVPLATPLLLMVGLFAAGGSVVGSYLLRRINTQKLQWAFSVGLAILGIVMLAQLGRG